MEIKSVSDKRVKQIIENPTVKAVKGLDKLVTKRVAAMIVAIQAMNNPVQLKDVSGWRAHDLKPLRPNTWSLWLTPNFRLTFLVDQEAGTVEDVDIEDYH